MIPYLLDHSKTLTALMSDNTAGLGALAECTKATVTEERNGEFSLSIQYPITGVHFKDIEVGGLIKAKPNETAALQIFRIKKISKPLRGIVTITANHISYDLGKTSVAPFSSIGAAATMTALKNNMTGGSAFTLSTDIPNTVNTFTNTKPQSLRALLGGQTGSLLDVFGGEYEFNNTSVMLHASRGSDSGIVLEYGKNITDIQQDENIENTYTAVMPYALDGSGNAIVGTLQTIIASAEPKILNLDLSEKYDIDETPTAETLNAYAQAYIAANDLATPSVSIKVSFVALWQTEEYKSIAPLERVRLCDTITVKFEKLGISATAKIISTEFDVLQERYNSIEVGDAKSTFASTISGIASSVQESATSTAGYLDGAISMFTSLIANGMGLFVTKEAVGTTGGVKFYLHNKPTRAESQYQWTINASGFAVSQDYGETWTAGIDASGNALFNSVAANEINAMKITGSTISGSEMVFDPDGQPVTASGSRLGVNNGVIFTGAGDFTVETQTVGLTGTGDSNGQEIQILGKNNGTNRNLIRFKDTRLSIIHYDANGDEAIRIILDDTNGLGIYFNGVGYSGLGFVNDGNGHAVLGV